MSKGDVNRNRSKAVQISRWYVIIHLSGFVVFNQDPNSSPSVFFDAISVTSRVPDDNNTGKPLLRFSICRDRLALENSLPNT